MQMLSPALLFRHLGAGLLVRGGRTGVGRRLLRVHRREETGAEVSNADNRYYQGLA